VTPLFQTAIEGDVIMATASARHILVETEDACNDLKTQIEEGAEFTDMAKDHSKCPSGSKGGSLGEFTPGQMVKEFDEVVFSAEVGKVHGPVKTDFGYHLIEITSRTD
jgi:peptidyl-prolyl cis-trans isomerase C